MGLSRRQLLRLVSAAAALPVLPRMARPQGYPTRRARIVVSPRRGLGSRKRVTMAKLKQARGEQPHQARRC